MSLVKLSRLVLTAHCALAVSVANSTTREAASWYAFILLLLIEGRDAHIQTIAQKQEKETNIKQINIVATGYRA